MNKYFKKSAFKKGCYRIILALMFTGTGLSTIGQTVFQGNTVKKPAVKISLNAYSFTKPLLDKVRGRGEGMTFFQMMDWAAQHDFDGVDLTGYFFPGYPNVPSDEYINEIKKYAFRLGLDITGTGVRNNFADPDPAKRAADVKHVKEWVDVAVKLGAPVLRIFAGPIPEGYENRREEIENYMAASMRECAEYGKLRGVLIGVQNHGDFLKTAEQTISLIKKINSDWLGVIVDSGYFITEDPYVDIEKTMPYAVNFQLKLSVFGAASKIKIDLPRIMDIMARTNYRGYLPIEILSPAGGNKARKQNTGVAASSEKNTWDPFAVLPPFMKEVKAAQIQKFGR